MRTLPGFLFSFLALLLAPLPTLAQADTPPAVEAAEGTEGENKASILVLPIQAKTGVEPGLTQLIDDKVTVELSDYPDFKVLSRSDVQQLLELEAERSAVGCDMDSSCLAEIAGAMGAQFVVSGRMGKLGSRFTLTFSLYDSHKATNINRVNHDDDSLDKIVDALPGLTAKLVQPLLHELNLKGKDGKSTPVANKTSGEPDRAVPADTSTGTTSSKVTKTANADTSVTADAAEGEAEEGLGAIWWLVPGGLGAAGAAVLSAGVIIDLALFFSESGLQGQLDLTDAPGPILTTVGVGTLGIAVAAAVVVLIL